MNIAVLIKQVPDLVEGVEIAADHRTLDADSLRFVLSEADDHALEQALLLKERGGGRVEVFTLDAGEARDLLFTALAKGADRAVAVDGGLEGPLDNHALAQVFAGLLRGQPWDLILTGVRAIDDLDGSLGGLLAGLLDLPYAGLIRKVETAENGAVVVQKEFPGGYAAELEVRLPAVLGIQAAEKPPRYVPVSRLRQVMKTAKVEEAGAPPLETSSLRAERMFKPVEGGGATMLPGAPAELARRIAGLFAERRLLR
jgi:electron transfer flavoprotein beta subunit